MFMPLLRGNFWEKREMGSNRRHFSTVAGVRPRTSVIHVLKIHHVREKYFFFLILLLQICIKSPTGNKLQTSNGFKCSEELRGHVVVLVTCEKHRQVPKTRSDEGLFVLPDQMCVCAAWEEWLLQPLCTSNICMQIAPSYHNSWRKNTVKYSWM